MLTNLSSIYSRLISQNTKSEACLNSVSLMSSSEIILSKQDKFKLRDWRMQLYMEGGNKDILLMRSTISPSKFVRSNLGTLDPLWSLSRYQSKEKLHSNFNTCSWFNDPCLGEIRAQGSKIAKLFVCLVGNQSHQIKISFVRTAICSRTRRGRKNLRVFLGKNIHYWDLCVWFTIKVKLDLLDEAVAVPCKATESMQKIEAAALSGSDL